MRLLSLLVVFIFSKNILALNLPEAVEKEYLKLGGNSHALDHLKCFLQNYDQTDFSLRSAKLSERCNGMSDEKATIQINNPEYITLVDYTKPSSERRLFILHLEATNSPYVETYYVSHGRYKNTPSNNTVPGLNKNTVKWLEYYSNEKGSNATSSGFYITGHKYKGRWSGPKSDKYSLIVHGINTDLNDNACDRAVVLHGNSFINENGDKEGVSRMSSGCFMLDYDYVNDVFEKIRGGGGDHYKDEDRLGGTLLFVYGKKEAQQKSNLYCSSESEELLRIK